VFVFRFIATPKGLVPTAIVVVTVFVEPFITERLFEK
jgi:hypothetical protein